MCGWVLALQAGISVLSLGTAVSCTSFFQGSAGDMSQDELEKGGEGGATFPHPAKATAEATKILLAAHGAEAAEGLADCRSQIEAIGARATSEGALMGAYEEVLPIVEDDEEGYHWCFFATAADFDRQLDNVSLTLEQKTNQFLTVYRALWPLAKALDELTGGEGYFSYLQTRYLAISAEYFGRELEPSGTSFPHKASSEQKKKPAGKFKE